MDVEIKKFLSELHGTNGFDFNKLIDFIEYNQIPIKAKKIRAMGFTHFDNIYINVDYLRTSGHQLRLIYFLFLHEIYHYKRMHKLGKAHLVSILAEQDYDVFFENIVDEEKRADRYGMRMYYKLTGFEFPEYLTQQLNKPAYRERYHQNAKRLHKLVSREETYDTILDYVIVE